MLYTLGVSMLRKKVSFMMITPCSKFMTHLVSLYSPLALPPLILLRTHDSSRQKLRNEGKIIKNVHSYLKEGEYTETSIYVNRKGSKRLLKNTVTYYGMKLSSHGGENLQTGSPSNLKNRVVEISEIFISLVLSLLQMWGQSPLLK